jgi:hypothetical protein
MLRAALAVCLRSCVAAVGLAQDAYVKRRALQLQVSVCSIIRSQVICVLCEQNAVTLVLVLNELRYPAAGGSLTRPWQELLQLQLMAARSSMAHSHTR